MPTPEAPCFELLMITISLPKEPQRERPGVQQNQIDPLAARIVRKVPPSARRPTPIGFGTRSAAAELCVSYLISDTPFGL